LAPLETPKEKAIRTLLYPDISAILLDYYAFI